MTTSHYFYDLDVTQALCAQTDPELFFPEKGETASHAKRICKECPIQKECLEVALKRNYIDGVWGGLTPKERARLLGRGWNRGRMTKKLVIEPKGGHSVTRNTKETDE